MNFVVIGLGSMGKRRIRLLNRIISNGLVSGDSVIIGIDSNETRRREAEEQFDIITHASLDDLETDNTFDAAVISTSPLSHAHIIEECLRRELHVFSEINLVSDGYDKNIALSIEKKKVLFLSSTPMYRKEIKYIKDYVTCRKCGIYHYNIGQYLPEWHPWENYKDFFVGDKRTNGCREIFGIELPWIIDAFGGVMDMHSFHKKNSSLNISYDDCYTVILEHSSGIIGNISVDVITPIAGRKLEVWGESNYLEWRGTPDSLKIFGGEIKDLRPVDLYNEFEHNENYNKFVIEDAYYDELINFINTIDGTEVAKHTFEKDADILSLIDRIEE